MKMVCEETSSTMFVVRDDDCQASQDESHHDDDHHPHHHDHQVRFALDQTREYYDYYAVIHPNYILYPAGPSKSCSNNDENEDTKKEDPNSNNDNNQSSSSYPPVHVGDLWYSLKELKFIHNENIRIVKYMKKLGVLDNNNNNNNEGGCYYHYENKYQQQVEEEDDYDDDDYYYHLPSSSNNDIYNNNQQQPFCFRGLEQYDPHPYHHPYHTKSRGKIKRVLAHPRLHLLAQESVLTEQKRQRMLGIQDPELISVIYQGQAQPAREQALRLGIMDAKRVSSLVKRAKKVLVEQQQHQQPEANTNDNNTNPCSTSKGMINDDNNNNNSKKKTNRPFWFGVGGFSGRGILGKALRQQQQQGDEEDEEEEEKYTIQFTNDSDWDDNVSVLSDLLTPEEMNGSKSPTSGSDKNMKLRKMLARRIKGGMMLLKRSYRAS